MDLRKVVLVLLRWPARQKLTISVTATDICWLINYSNATDASNGDLAWRQFHLPERVAKFPEGYDLRNLIAPLSVALATVNPCPTEPHLMKLFLLLRAYLQIRDGIRLPTARNRPMTVVASICSFTRSNDRNWFPKFKNGSKVEVIVN